MIEQRLPGLDAVQGMVLECQSLGVLELLVATEEGGPFRAKTSRISQQVHHMLIDQVTKALDWVKMSENLFSCLACVVTQSNQHTRT